MRKHTTIDSIIERLGGQTFLAKRLGVTRQAINRWRTQGLPKRQWPIVIALGYSMEEVYTIDMLAKSKLKKKSHKRTK